MLQILLHTIIISFICMIWGLPAFIFIKKNSNEKYWLNQGITIFVSLFFMGLLSLAIISSWFFLLIPLKFSYLVTATIILALLLVLLYKPDIKKTFGAIDEPINFTLLQWIFIIAGILLFIILGTLQPANSDTEIYHLQIIRWTNEYAIVPGLANLYPRLGLGSSWFNLISLFHIPALKYQNFTFLNVTITIWFLLWLISKWNHHRLQKDNYNKIFSCLYFVLILYFLFDWQLFRDTANSTAYDFIVTVLTIFCLSFLAEDIFIKSTGFSFVFIILSISILAFKLSGIFILILSLFYLFRFRKINLWVKTLAAACVIIIPVLIKNYILTGYILFPSTFNFASPEWQVPEIVTNQFGEYIMNANKFYNTKLRFIDSYEKTTFNWIPFWIKGILWQHKLILLLSLSSLLIFFYRIPFSVDKKRMKLFCVSLWLIMLGWFFTAPDPRFAFGYILFLAFFPLCFLLGKYFSPIVQNIFLSFSILVTVLYISQKIKPVIDQPEYLIHTVPVNQPPYKTQLNNGLPIHYPEKINGNWNSRCFFTPLPCMNEPNPFVRLRGNEISKGFRMDQPDSNFIKNYNF